MFRKLLSSEFAPYAELTATQLDQLEDHYNLLVRWNRLLNLTRIEDVAEAVRFHYCESLFLGVRLPKGPLKVADVGSGGGFPGIPIAILRPDLEVVLIESHQRKAVFLREAARDLSNVRVSSTRAERWGERADWVVSRAVSPQDVLATRIAQNFALLLASKDAPGGSKVTRTPWGADRVVAVSRGTISRETLR